MNEHMRVEEERVQWGVAFRVTCSWCGLSDVVHLGQPIAPYDGWERDTRESARRMADDAASAHVCAQHPAS